MTGPDVTATNSFEHPDTIGVRERRVPATGDTLVHEFPARSLSILRMELHA